MDALPSIIQSWFEPNRVLVGNITTSIIEHPIRAPNYWQLPFLDNLFDTLWFVHRPCAFTFYSNDGTMFQPTYEMDKDARPFDVVVVAEWSDPDFKRMAKEYYFDEKKFNDLLTVARRRLVKNGTLVFMEPPEPHLVAALEKMLGIGRFVKHVIQLPSKPAAITYYVTTL